MGTIEKYIILKLKPIPGVTEAIEQHNLIRSKQILKITGKAIDGQLIHAIPVWLHN